MTHREIKTNGAGNTRENRRRDHSAADQTPTARANLGSRKMVGSPSNIAKLVKYKDLRRWTSTLISL